MQNYVRQSNFKYRLYIFAVKFEILPKKPLKKLEAWNCDFAKKLEAWPQNGVSYKKNVYILHIL